MQMYKFSIQYHTWRYTTRVFLITFLDSKALPLATSSLMLFIVNEV